MRKLDIGLDARVTDPWNGGLVEAHRVETREQGRPTILALAHSPNLAGAQLALASLIKNTTDQLDWRVVSPGNGPFVKKVEPNADVIVTERFPWWCRGAAYTAPPFEFDVARLNNVFDDVDYDLALTNTITVPWLAYDASRRDRPHMWYIHEYGDLDHGLDFAVGYDRTIRYVWDNSDLVMTVSRSVGEHLLEHGASEDKLRYVRQSFEIDEYLELGPPADDNSLLTLGAIKSSKGQLDALVGFNESTIRDTHTLTIAGPVTEPWYAERIREFIDDQGLGDRVDFIPERVNAIEQMRRASTVLVCSRNEALGRITLEALAAGRTVVGSRGGGTAVLLDESRGVLYDGSTTDLTSKLDELGQSVYRLQPVEARQQYVVDNFSPERERDDFLAAIALAEDHHARSSSRRVVQQMGKTGILDAMHRIEIIA